METTGETQQRSVDGRSKKKRVVVRSSTGLEDDFMQSDFSSLNDISGDSNTRSSSILNGQNRPNSLDDDDAKEEILLPVEIEENIIKLQLIDLFRGYEGILSKLILRYYEIYEKKPSLLPQFEKALKQVCNQYYEKQKKIGVQPGSQEELDHLIHIIEVVEESIKEDQDQSMGIDVDGVSDQVPNQPSIISDRSFNLMDINQQLNLLLHEKHELEAKVTEYEKEKAFMDERNQELNKLLKMIKRSEIEVRNENEALLQLNESLQSMLAMNSNGSGNLNRLMAAESEQIKYNSNESNHNGQVESQVIQDKDKNDTVSDIKPAKKATFRKMSLKKKTLNVFKIVLVGDSGVGKTSFIHRFCYDDFVEDHRVTLDIGFEMSTVMVDDTPVSLQVWDTVGQERFRSLPQSYYRDANGILLLYDITRQESFANIQGWIADIKDNASENVLIMITGNKLDLQDQREIKSDTGSRLAMLHDAMFTECSAKTGESVEESFHQLVRHLMQRQMDGLKRKKLDLYRARSFVRLNTEENASDTARKGSCCL